jgi:hypothetical protein
MNRDPRFALSQELEAKQPLLEQLRALVAEDPDFLTDLIEGETDLLELIAALEGSILDDEALVDRRRANAPSRPASSSGAAADRPQDPAHAHLHPLHRGSQPQGDCRRPRRHPRRPLVETTAAQTRSGRAHQGGPRPRQSLQGSRSPHGSGGTPPGTRRGRDHASIGPRRHRIERRHHPLLDRLDRHIGGWTGHARR